MGSLFSKHPKKEIRGGKYAEITDKDRAILDLKNVRDKLRRFRGKLEKDSTKLELQAKELIALRQKNRALLVLKLKRFKQKELDEIDSRLMNILSLIQDVEWASINLDVINAIESGTKELNRIHDERSLEDVEALMEDTNEAIEAENQINKVLAGQLNIEDDAELEKELDLILKEFSTDNTTPVTVSDLSPVNAAEDNCIGTHLNEDIETVNKTEISLPEVPTSPILHLAPKHEISAAKKEKKTQVKKTLVSS